MKTREDEDSNECEDSKDTEEENLKSWGFRRLYEEKKNLC